MLLFYDSNRKNNQYKLTLREDMHNIEELILKMHQSLVTSNGRLYPQASSHLVEQMQSQIIPTMNKSRKEKQLLEKPPPSEIQNPKINLLPPPQRNMMQNLVKSLKELLGKINSKTISVTSKLFH